MSEELVAVKEETAQQVLFREALSWMVIKQQ